MFVIAFGISISVAVFTVLFLTTMISVIVEGPKHEMAVIETPAAVELINTVASSNTENTQHSRFNFRDSVSLSC